MTPAAGSWRHAGTLVNIIIEATCNISIESMKSYKKCKILRFYAAPHIHTPENTRVRPVVAHITRPDQTPQRYLCLGFVCLQGP